MRVKILSLTIQYSLSQSCYYFNCYISKVAINSKVVINMKTITNLKVITSMESLTE